jgi:hypothetical protein
VVVKTVGSSGQISIGKQYAGRHVLVDEREPGVWVIKLGDFVPDNERWLHDPEVKAQLDKSLAWLSQNPPRETDLDELEEKLMREKIRDAMVPVGGPVIHGSIV